MKTLQEIHAEIKAVLPAATFLIVQHGFKNYDDGDSESWDCQAYADHDQPLDNMFMVHRANDPESLIEQAKAKAIAYKPDITAKVAALKRQIAKLEEMDMAA